ncbi:hypothetical protein C0992_010769 [Termitomyces sp. T32_za158]|nr:hypothetical protein C0992_010769 [Termitomyces sp. T32_za158]
MVDAYLRWCKDSGISGKELAASFTQDAVIQKTQPIKVVDIFVTPYKETYDLDVPMLQGGKTIAASLILQGLIPSAPYHPNVAFSIRSIEIYRTTHLRCPHLAIQPFVKSLCDIHGVPSKPYLSKQFSIAYDVYLSIRHEAKKRIQAALKCDMPKWRLQHACPACTYKLEGPATEGEDGELSPGESKELRDDRALDEDYYLSKEAVDQWTKGALKELLPTGKDAEEEAVGSESNPCAESAKYPLAIVNELLQAFGMRIGNGYDIGCKFRTTLANSSLGLHAHELEYKSLLDFLAKYVEGLGLEDLEGCERFFSKSNVLALSVQYASIFHWKQSIQEYCKHMDRQETYQNLSDFLVNNYKQALKLISGLPVLEKQMADQGVAGVDTFKCWLAEEKQYLQGLSREPVQETLQMEYYEKLVNLEASKKTLDKAQSKWLVITTETHSACDYTQSTETKCRHALENLEKDLKIVQSLEIKLGIMTR